MQHVALQRVAACGISKDHQASLTYPCNVTCIIETTATAPPNLLQLQPCQERLSANEGRAATVQDAGLLNYLCVLPPGVLLVAVLVAIMPVQQPAAVYWRENYNLAALVLM
jgi:hypothetical protein